MPERPSERPAPLVLVVDPAAEAESAVPGSYVAAAAAGRRLLAAELSHRLGHLGAAVTPLRAEPPGAPDAAQDFHWGRWFAAGARTALADAAGRVDAIGYAGAGALALLPDERLDDLLSPLAGQVVANSRFSADAFVVAGDAAALERAVAALERSPSDNSAPRALETAGFGVRDLGEKAWVRFDVDTPLDLALLRLSTRLPRLRRPEQAITSFLEMARLPGGRGLEVPNLAALGEVIRDRGAELVVAGRVPSAVLHYLETQTACRVRAFVEERGMRSARDVSPRSLLAHWLSAHDPGELIRQLSGLGDAVILDTRVLMAAHAGSSEAAAWPPEEERFASDFLDAAHIGTPWLADLTTAAAEAPIPFVLGGHALVSDGLRILTEAAWLGH
jgi:hypothetical protein